MEFFPRLELSLTGGWIILIWLYITQTTVLLAVGKDVRKRLLDRSNFIHKQWLIATKIIGVLLQILALLTPLALNSPEFFIGVSLFIVGMIGEVIAVINFRMTPLNEPVTRGFYRISRNPQETMLTISIFGICFAVGSWFLVILFILSRILNHFQILAQEEACLNVFGDSYRNYMKKVPRYFLFF